MFLKRIALIDCLTLAALFMLRIIAGALAIDILLSFWLLVFSLFIFLSLAFLKRYAELQVQTNLGNTYAHGRGYVISDGPFIQALGISAGYGAVLVLALYLQGDTVIQLYKTVFFLWFEVPIMLFWVSWVWMKAHRGEMHDDPTIFALKDKTSVIAAALMTVIFFMAAIY